jgi:hypothetical protein
VIKRIVFIVFILTFLIGVVACSAGNSADKHILEEMAKNFFYEGPSSNRVENVEVISVDIYDDGSAEVKLKVKLGEYGPFPSEEEYCKLYYDKYGDEWVLIIANYF